MRLFKHKGCTTPLIRYVGPEPLEGRKLVSKEWEMADGSLIAYSAPRSHECPDCSKQVWVGPEELEPV